MRAVLWALGLVAGGLVALAAVASFAGWLIGARSTLESAVLFAVSRGPLGFAEIEERIARVLRIAAPFDQVLGAALKLQVDGLVIVDKAVTTVTITEAGARWIAESRPSK